MSMADGVGIGESPELLSVPMDDYIQGGIRVTDINDLSQQNGIIDRLAEGYMGLRDVKRQETGICLAYIVEPDKMIVKGVDTVIRRAISTHSFDTIIYFENPYSGRHIAAGREGTRTVSVVRRLTRLLMEDETKQLSCVYAFQSR